MTDEQTQKLTRLFLKIIAGIVFTDLEALPASYIKIYAEKICRDVGETGSGENIFNGMIKLNILTFSAEYNGEPYYTHNIPKTIQVNHYVTNDHRTKRSRD